MIKLSCGILLYKFDAAQQLFVLLAHPGGPLWSHKDSWTLPKGEVEPDEELIAAAKREFEEEVGIKVPPGKLIDLGTIAQSSVKHNHIWKL